MIGFVFTIMLFAADLAVIIFFILIFISSVTSSIGGAPFVPINKNLVKEIIAFGCLSADDIFYDLGCGDGRVLISAIKDFGVKKAIGYEVSLWPYLIAKLKIRRAGLMDRIEIHRKSFFDANLSGASFVYMYLFPKLVNRLAEKILRECRPGTKILCPSFPIDIFVHPQFRLLKTQKIATISVYLYQLM